MINYHHSAHCKRGFFGTKFHNMESSKMQQYQNDLIIGKNIESKNVPLAAHLIKNQISVIHRYLNLTPHENQRK